MGLSVMPCAGVNLKCEMFDFELFYGFGWGVFGWTNSWRGKFCFRRFRPRLSGHQCDALCMGKFDVRDMSLFRFSTSFGIVFCVDFIVILWAGVRPKCDK